MKKLMQIVAVSFPVSLAAMTANAVPINLGSLIGGGSITIGDKIFADFGFDSPDFAASDATVEATSDPSGTYYLTIQGPFVSNNADVKEFGFRYTVATTSGQPLISAIDQSFFLKSGGTGGTILMGETVRDGSFVGPTVAQSGLRHISGVSSDLEDPAPEPLAGDHLDIDPHRSKIWVDSDVFFQANPGALVGPTIIIQSFHQVSSVPDGGATAALLGVALSGLGLCRRRMSA